MAVGSAETIKEFLVDLGFRVDESTLRRFNIAIDDTTKLALKVGATVIGAATAIETFVNVMADRLEELYFAAQRSGTTVAALEAFELRARAVGLAAGEGASALENFRMAIERSPGLQHVLETWGITVDFQHMDKTLDATIAHLRKLYEGTAMERAVAIQWAEEMGITQRQLQSLSQQTDEDRKRITAAYDTFYRAFGTNIDDIAKRSADFSQRWREDVTTGFDAAARVLADHFLPVAYRFREWIKESLTDFALLIVKFDEFREKIQKGDKTNLVVGGYTLWGPEDQKVFDFLTKPHPEWTDALQEFYKTFNVEIGEFLKWSPSVTTFLENVREITKSISDFWDRITGSISGTFGGGVGAVGGGGVPAESPASPASPASPSLWDRVKGYFGTTATPSSAATDAVGRKIVSRLTTDLGLTPAQAAGFAGQSWGESGWNPRAIGKGGDFGLFQLVGERKQRYLRWCNANGLDPYDADNQITFTEMELRENQALLAKVRATSTAAEAEIASGPYEYGAPYGVAYTNWVGSQGQRIAGAQRALGLSLTSPGVTAPLPPADTGKSPAPDVLLNQSNTYNIYSSGSADDVAKHVGDIQLRTNDELVRTLRGAAH